MMRPRMSGWCARDLRRSATGSVATEFAMVAPIFMMMMGEIFNLGQMVYGMTALNGAVHAAARRSALENGNTAAADNMVKQIVGGTLPDATFVTTRKSYYDFVDIDRPEKWNDANNNGTCDNNEAYVDENRSGHWENDVGVAGNGGANDVVVYKVEATYKPLFKIPFAPQSWQTTKLSSTTVKKNQPFATQTPYGTDAGICA